MNIELQKKLFEKYPKIFKSYLYIDTLDGWFWIISNLCEKLQYDIDVNKESQIYVLEIKEKFGGLRFYVDIASDKQYDIISFAEYLSLSICEICGSTEAKVISVNKTFMSRCHNCTCL